MNAAIDTAPAPRRMASRIDRGFAILMFVGAAGHTVGTFDGYPLLSETFVWSLSGSLAAILIGAINFVRAGRPDDRAIAWIALFGSLAWMAVALGFGFAIGSPLDPRAIVNVVVAAVLAAFSAGTVSRRAGTRRDSVRR